MPFAKEEILETIRMVELEHLDIRTVTMGISLLDCKSSTPDETSQKVYDKVCRLAGNLVKVAERVEMEYGLPIVNKRISVTPISIIGNGFTKDDYIQLAIALDNAAKDLDVNFIGGYSALVHKGFTIGDIEHINSIPEALAITERVCSSVNIATTASGINMDAVKLMGEIIKSTAKLTADKDSIGCAKLVVFANVPEDNPFMAGAFHGVGEPECVLSVGISGPGVINSVVQNIPDADFGELSDVIKRTTFKITRAGELIGRTVAERLGVSFGIVDLSLAPTPAIGDSIADILEGMGLERAGAPGSTAAIALLNDAVKKGGAMASSYVGGLSGAFIPVSEDAGMIRAAKEGALTLEKLEAMTSVCSVGLDMVVIPGDTSAATISAIIADEAAIGVINRKTTAVRLIPAYGKKEGEWVNYGGLLGESPVMPVNKFNCEKFIARGGRIPAPLSALRN